MLPRFADTALDRLIAPGYSRLGYAARSALWADTDPAPDALAGKTVVVTGATGGIGLAAAEGVARLGAATILVGRSEERLQQAASTLRGRLPQAGFRLEVGDLSSLASVRDLAGRLTLAAPALHAVVHNAGVMPPERTTTAEGNELTLATHVLGPHLLSRLLRPAPARTIWVSSGGMYAQRLDLSDIQSVDDYKPATAYAKTKRMQVVLAQEWAQRRRGEGVVHAMHPGWVDTPGLVEGLSTFHKLTKPILRTPAQGADTIVWLVAGEEPGRTTGGFWHDRRARPTHYLPLTHEDAADRSALWELCEDLT